MRLGIALVTAFCLVPLASASGTKPVPPGMARITGGSFRPLYAQPGERIARVDAFAIDTVPVSSVDFLRFVAEQPRWARGRTPAMLADANYLARVIADRTKAITQVSWFAATAYCGARGARLPTTNEWEYVARASESSRDATTRSGFKQRVLELAMAADPKRFRIGAGFRNVWGVRDLHGGLIEWTADFQTIFSGPGHTHGHQDRALTCSAGAVDTGDASDYAAFLRYAFRGSADTRTTAGNVGFRCAASL